MADTSPTKSDDGKSNWVQFNEDGSAHNSLNDAVEGSSKDSGNENTIEEQPESLEINCELQNSPQISPRKQKTVNWVQFDDGNEPGLPSPSKKSDYIRNNGISPPSNSTSAAVIATNEQQALQASKSHPLSNTNNASPNTDGTVMYATSSTDEPSVDVSSHWPRRQAKNPSITQGFTNGDCIVTVLPLNQKCPWLTKAEFKPELVPEELMAQGLTLTVEDYVQAMKILVSDFRFNMFIICYKRILIAWILIGFIFLISFLFSGLRGIILFVCGIVWLVLNAVGIFFCMWFKIKLSHGLEYCMAEVNSYLFKQKIILALDDRGKLSCHKVNLIFLYFDTTDCIKYLSDMLTRGDEGRTAPSDNPRRELDLSRMDIDESGITIVGKTNTILSLQQQKRAEKLLLRYLQRWAKDFVRKRLDLNVDLYNEGQDFRPISARHCVSARCPCQYIEEYLSYKPDGKCACTQVFVI